MRVTVERVAVGGSAEGATSAYVLPERGVVVDPGPPGEWSAFREGIERAGLALGDVEHVLVTHWHVDHAGLAPQLADRAGATLGMHAGDAPLVGDYAAERERRVERDAARMTRWGVPEARVAAVVDGDHPSPMPATCPVDHLADGDRPGGLEVVHAPGHTRGHAAFRAEGVLLVGDAVLAGTTPNVGGSDTRMADPLGTYLASLDRIEGLVRRGGHETAAPGHGATVNLPGRVHEIRDHHRDRARRTLAALEDATVADGSDGPGATPWSVARRLFGVMTGVHVKFGAGEAAAHLARLAAQGVVREVGNDPLRYRPTGESFEGTGE